MSVEIVAEECPQLLVDSAAIISIEGRFVNREHSRVHVDIMWQHEPLSADTFDISLPHSAFRYVSAPQFRYVEIKPENIRRQMAMHHLKEFIGETPLKWDDFELLARGSFLCPDSLHRDSTILYTAISQTWFTLNVEKSQPDSVRMSGPAGEKRKIFIHSWKSYDGIFLPAILDIQGSNYSGSLWIRTAKRVPAKQNFTPEEKPAKEEKSFLWNWSNAESEVPLILQMH